MNQLKHMFGDSALLSKLYISMSTTETVEHFDLMTPNSCAYMED